MSRSLPGSYLCKHCGHRAVLGYDDTHSNRCPLFGGHSEERCGSCGRFYVPVKGQVGDGCPSCA